MEVYQGAHSVYRLQYHVIWVCKYCRKILNPGVSGYLRKILPQLLRSMPGVKMETIGFDLEHVHMVLVILSSYSISEMDEETTRKYIEYQGKKDFGQLHMEL